MTGIETAADTAAVSGQSKPALVPSRSIDVSRNLAGAARLGFPRPLDGVAVGGRLSAARVDGETVVVALGVDGDEHGLAAVAFGQRRDQRRIRERGGVEAHLVGAGLDRRGRVGLGANAAAYGERNEQLARDARESCRRARAALRSSP